MGPNLNGKRKRGTTARFHPLIDFSSCRTPAELDDGRLAFKYVAVYQVLHPLIQYSWISRNNQDSNIKFVPW